MRMGVIARHSCSPQVRITLAGQHRSIGSDPNGEDVESRGVGLGRRII